MTIWSKKAKLLHFLQFFIIHEVCLIQQDLWKKKSAGEIPRHVMKSKTTTPLKTNMPQVLPSDPFWCFEWPFQGLSDLPFVLSKGHLEEAGHWKIHMFQIGSTSSNGGYSMLVFRVVIVNWWFRARGAPIFEDPLWIQTTGPQTISWAECFLIHKQFAILVGGWTNPSQKY